MLSINGKIGIVGDTGFAGFMESDLCLLGEFLCLFVWLFVPLIFHNLRILGILNSYNDETIAGEGLETSLIFAPHFLSLSRMDGVVYSRPTFLVALYDKQGDTRGLFPPRLSWK